MALIVILISTVLYMSRDAEHRKSEHYEQTQMSSPKSSIPPHDGGKCTQNATESEKYPTWIDTFTWPEGATAWALFLTLIIVGWQANETRRTVAISQKALIFEYRPRVIVRTLKLIPVKADAGQIADWQIEMVVANIGGTMAYIKPWSLRAESSFPGAGEMVQSVVGGFELAGGESRSIEVVMEGEEWRVSMRSLTFTVQQLGKEQRRYPIVSGTISYGDDNKIMRRTGFRRSWDAKEERFLPSTDPEYEYQD